VGRSGRESPTGRSRRLGSDPTRTSNGKWRSPAGSSRIVAGDKLIITALDGGKLYTIAYRRSDGKEAWRAHAPAKKLEVYYQAEGRPAASTPATDGVRIVSYFGSCGLFCYDLDGKELWKLEMPPAVTGGFGSGVSPIIADGLVILVRDGIKGREDPRARRGYRLGALGEKAAKRHLLLHAGGLGNARRQTGGIRRARADGRLRSPDRRREMVGGRHAVAALLLPGGHGGTLLFAGWSPGGPVDKETPMPSFDELLKQGDANKDGVLTKDEAEKVGFKDFFDNFDTNGDGKLTRGEWDAILKFIAEGKNVAFAVKTGGTGNVTNSHVLWRKTRGLPYIASGLVYRGQYILVKDGGLVTAYDAKTGKDIYLQERVAGPGR
jgi:hypothetical protein